MNNLVKLAIPASLAVLLSACGQSGTSTMPGGVSTQSQAHQVSNAPLRDAGPSGSIHVMPLVGHQAAHPNLSGLLNWGGGAVQHVPKIYVIYWGFGKSGTDPNGVQAQLNAFLDRVGGTAWLSTDTEYYDGKGNITNPAPQYVGEAGKKLKACAKGSDCIIDKSTPPTHPTDSQIQQEAAKLVAKFGKNVDASYVVQTSHNHNTLGFGTQWCAYHGSFNSGGTKIAYTNLPYMPDAAGNCGAGFVNNPGTLDGVTIVEGHELAETQTDPGADYSGWGGSYGEIGDICAWDSTTSNQPFGTKTFPVQPLYSDVASACTLTGPNGP